MKYILILFALLFLSPVTSAIDGIDIKIINNTIVVEGYTVSLVAGKIPAGFVSKVNESLGPSINCAETLNITEGNNTRFVQTNCSLSLSYVKEVPFNFNASGNIILTDVESQQKYLSCLEEKTQYKLGFTTCSNDIINLKDINTNFTKCTTDLQICQSEKSTAISEKSNIQTTQEENKNKHYTWGVGGLIAGIIGALYYTGRIGGPKMRKPEEQFNRQQSA